MVKGEQGDLAAGLWLDCREGSYSCRVEQRKLAVSTGTWAQERCGLRMLNRRVWQPCAKSVDLSRMIETWMSY